MAPLSKRYFIFCCLVWPIKRFSPLTYKAGSTKFTKASVPSQYDCAT